MDDKEKERKIIEYMAKKREVFEELCLFTLKALKEKVPPADGAIIEGAKIILNTNIWELVRF